MLQVTSLAKQGRSRWSTFKLPIIQANSCILAHNITLFCLAIEVRQRLWNSRKFL
jgi:hypothetical protein